MVPKAYVLFQSLVFSQYNSVFNMVILNLFSVINNNKFFCSSTELYVR